MPRGRAKGPGKRVVMNREAIDAILLGYADGMQLMGEAIIAAALPHVPDLPPIGAGLVKTGKAATFVNRKKVAGEGSAPRGAVPREYPVTLVGFGFPGHLVELGSIHNDPPKPFLTKGMVQVIPQGGDYVAPSVKKRLAKVRDK